MKVRAALVAVALVAVASIASAQTPARVFEPLAPAMSPAEFAKLGLWDLRSSNYTPGWDAIKSVPLRDGYLARFFYRKTDGLLVGVMEDYAGFVYVQTSAWYIGTNLDQFDITRITWPAFPSLDPAYGVLSLTFFGYNRTTGLATRKMLVWAPIPPLENKQ